MLCASPIIAAVINFDYEVSGQTPTVSGAKSIIVLSQDPNSNAAYVYVFNNKSGFLADIDPRFLTKPKEDFRRFRMLSASMQQQWAGPELFKAGVAVTARITDKDDLSTFDPNQKADNVISNISDVIVTTCQHVNPVFEFTDVDNNNDNGGGTMPDPEIEDSSTYNQVFNFNSANTSDKAFTFQFLTLSSAPTSNTNQKDFVGTVFGKAWPVMSASGEHSQSTGQIISAFDRKYPAFRGTANASGLHGYSCEIIAKAIIRPVGSADKITMTIRTRNTATSTNTLFYVAIFQTLEVVAPTDLGFSTLKVPASFVGFTSFNLDVEIVIKIPLNGEIDQRVTIPKDLSAPLARNMVAETPFFDDSFLQPVTQVNVSDTFPFTAQFQTCHHFEFVLDDTTVLGTAAVAHAPNDPESTVSKSQFDKFQKAMKGMPPALVMNDSGLTRVSKAQLKSRGVLSILHSIVSPLLSVVMPETDKYSNAFGQTANAIDAAY